MDPVTNGRNQIASNTRPEASASGLVFNYPKDHYSMINLSVVPSAMRSACTPGTR